MMGLQRRNLLRIVAAKVDNKFWLFIFFIGLADSLPPSLFTLYEL